MKKVIDGKVYNTATAEVVDGGRLTDAPKQHDEYGDVQPTIADIEEWLEKHNVHLTARMNEKLTELLGAVLETTPIRSEVTP